jgi:tetratricopeptide (TPR) repeat protein
MSRLRVDHVRALLPALDELRPLVGRLVSSSAPDPDRRWSASGELETVGTRLVQVNELEGSLGAVADGVRRELGEIYAAVARALRALDAGDAVGASRAFLEAAELEEARWRMDRAEAWALAAHRVVEGERDRGPAAVALRRAARAARGRGRLGDAFARYGAAYGLSSAAGDEVSAAIAAIGAGNVNVDRGRWTDAEGWYLKALAHLDRAPGVHAERWHASLNLSIVARRRGDLEESRRRLEQAEAAAGALAHPMRAVEVENEWGMWALAAGDAAAAEARFRSALAAARDPASPAPAVSRPGAVVTVLVNLGQALLEQGRGLEAAEVAREAEAEAIRAGVTIRLPEVYRLLGGIAAAGGHAEAFVFYERALTLIEQEGLSAWERAETLGAYARLLEREGRSDEAGAYRAEAESLRQSLGASDELGPHGANEE